MADTDQPALPFDEPPLVPAAPGRAHPAPGTEHPAPGATHPPSQTAPALAGQARPPATSDQIVCVRHPRARRYVIRVTGDGTVRVTVPRGGSKRAAEAFAGQQRAWIAKQRQRVEEERARPRPAPLAPDAERELRTRAAQVLLPRLHELAARHGVTVARASIRNQRWRWGSCSRRGHICLNWRVVQMPDHVRDYVLVHELMHLRRMDHSPAFWTLVEAACPDYAAARAWLRSQTRRHS